MTDPLSAPDTPSRSCTPQSEESPAVSADSIVQVLDRIGEGIAALDRAWVYTYVNEALAGFVGRKRDEMIGTKVWSLFPWVVGTQFQQSCLQAVENQVPGEVEEYYPVIGRWFFVRIYPSLSGLTLVVRDITQPKRDEDALRSSEERWHRLLKMTPVSMCLVATDGRMRFLNDRFVRTFGYTPDDIPTIDAWRNYAYPDPAYRTRILARWAEMMERARTQGTDVDPLDVLVTCRDGRIREVEVFGIQMTDGQLTAFVDVTDRKLAEAEQRAAQQETARLLAAAQRSRRVLLSVVEDQKAAEAALRQSEERYRSVLETSAHWVWETDTDFRYTYASPQVQELLGYKSEEVIGRTAFDFMPAAEASRVRTVIAPLLGACEPLRGLESVNLHRDGRLLVLETNASPYFGPDGQWRGYRGVDRDITARREAEKALRLRGAALEAAASAIVISDRNGTIEWVNPAFSTLTGWSSGEALGRNPRELVKSGKHDDAFYQEMWTTILAGDVWRGEIVNRRKDGTERIEDMTITPLRDAHGAVTHFITINQDITEQKALEAVSRQGQRMEVIGTLAGGIAHDLNNILAPVLMAAGVLKQKLPSLKDQELVALMEREAQRGANIVKQLLTFSRGNEGQRTPVQLRHVLKDLTLMMQETFPREIDVQLRADPRLWTVMADPTQFHQVLLNLCVNARDAMPNGGRLTVVAENVAIEEGTKGLPTGARLGPYVQIQIGDTGLGIDPQIKDRIFDPFFTTKPIGKGTGLGLSTVLAIMQAHHGFITVESSPEEGSTFKVYFPAVPDATELPVSGEMPAAMRGQGQMVLVVDDERNVREATRIVFEAGGFRILTAANGKEALEIYQQHAAEIRLVLTDVMMPVMNGVALAQALRAQAPSLPILATSGLAEADHRTELAALGVPEVISKPCPGNLLLEAVGRHLRDH